MKINPGYPMMKSNPVISDTPNKVVQQKNFSDVLQNHGTQATHDEVQRQFREIQMQGERLAKSMTLRELKSYQMLVKRFLEDTVRRGIGLKETHSFDRRGRSKKYKLLDEVDAALISMAEDLLNSEQGRIELLQRMGEIRGLLVNFLY
ncbi:YaaR family protein [Paenibacillus wulumuqiensis]|uniref:YaaR family protein n=1 Tax=Paenibacillus wulumuqiensis TaxID=1567107 RepID=UPI0006194AA2|nr:YaaR family protein [Paenibacillus wulumuqiensis]